MRGRRARTNKQRIKSLRPFFFSRVPKLYSCSRVIFTCWTRFATSVSRHVLMVEFFLSPIGARLNRGRIIHHVSIFTHVWPLGICSPIDACLTQQREHRT